MIEEGEQDVLVFVSYEEVRDEGNISSEEFKDLDEHNPDSIYDIAENIANKKLKKVSVKAEIISSWWDEEGIYFANFHLRDSTLSNALEDDNCIKL